MSKWILQKETANIKLMSETLNISPIASQVMVNRNIRSKNTAVKFLHPYLNFFHDTTEMKGLEIAMKIIDNSIANKEKIVIYGDYDADGITSTVILYKTLKAHKADVSFYIPQREEEGYGLNSTAVQNLKQADCDLLLTCDNGIASLEEIALAKAIGMKVIVIDHHEPGFVIAEDNKKADILPIADAIVNPKQEDCNYPFKDLCAAGICYKFSKAFYEYKKTSFNNDKELLVLAMLATFCDIVDLKDENRILVKNGLAILNENKKINKGLYSLMKEKFCHEKEITAFTVGFVLGPCINASGRLESANIAVELFLSEDDSEAEKNAKYLSELNETRKTMTKKAFDDALLTTEEKEYNKDSVIVIFNENIHESIAGIVAGRIKEAYFKPTIVLTMGEEFAKGSARSIESYNIFEELYACRILFERFGGHPMAAGLSLKPENIDILRETLNKNCRLTTEDFIEKIYIDEELEVEKISLKLAEELKVLEPFGKANKEPLFLSRNLIPESLRFMEEKSTIILSFKIPYTYKKIKAICFGLNKKFKENLLAIATPDECESILGGNLKNSNFLIDTVYSVEINEYNGMITVQMRIKDFILHKP